MPSITQQLILHEGIRKTPYMDTTGKTTIGVGRNLSDNGLSDDEIRFLLQNDINEAELRCRQLYPWFEALDFVRRKVLIDLMFNMGPRKLGGFTRFLRCMAEQDYHEAAKALRNSVWAQQVKGRADRLIPMIRTGEDYTT